ncbi:MAG: hypothetical protein M3Y24_12240 [Acidobacteriota bacterium]|nr:hypothetical protein [Acidobacteriota bacterium]
MKTSSLLIASLLLVSAHAFAQHEHEQGRPEGGAPHNVGGGHIPEHGPGPAPEHGGSDRGRQAPQDRGGHDNGNRPDSRSFSDERGHPDAPHVHADDRWVGHDSGRDDPHYRRDDPWEHGHFRGPIGHDHVYRLAGGGPGRFGFDGFFFGVAPYDYGYASGWWWDRDQIVLYDDPDHPGWYLANNVRLSTYIHVQYLG